MMNPQYATHPALNSRQVGNYLADVVEHSAAKEQTFFPQEFMETKNSHKESEYVTNVH